MILGPDIAAFITQGVAAAAGSRDNALRPSAARVLATRVDSERQRITLLLARQCNQVLLRDAESSQQLAVVFCLPSTERALQIKGQAIRIEAVQADDWARLHEHNEDFADLIEPKGYPREFAAHYHAATADDLIALSFAPTGVFEQTPGPQAGQPMTGEVPPGPMVDTAGVLVKPMAGSVNLDPLRDCFEGAVPAPLSTCAPDGVPNISYLSQVQYVDREHVALTFQFFNKTRRNVLANPQAQVTVVDPHTYISYRLTLQYQRTETSGPLFESMKAKLAGIASHTGMAGVYRLMGSDVYRVVAIEQLGSGRPRPQSRINNLPILRTLTQRFSTCNDLATLLDTTLHGLRDDFAISHAMILMLDETGQRLYTVASSGYAESGIGSEIPLGAGVIGVAARERTPIRISHMTAEYAYSSAMRAHSIAHGLDLETAIPLPGIAASRSQLAVPIATAQCCYGVIYVESDHDLRFTYDDEDALATLANHMAMLMQQCGITQESEADASARTATPPQGSAVRIRHFAADRSIFLDDDYLIKGVAGAIFWRLVQDYTQSGRESFSNRELRLDPSLALPELGDNLEARLLLLQRRLAERQACVQMERTGRGRFRLRVQRPLQLQADV